MTDSFKALCAILFFLVANFPLAAEQIEVGNGIYVTKKSFQVPANEQPFFGFIEKNEAQREADDRLLSSIAESGVSKEYAFNKAMLRGWQAFHKGDAALAGRRFNQAWLIDPTQAAVMHGFAVLAATRFNDPEYAEELFETGSRMDNRPPGYMADYGRFLLIQKRPKDALLILEDAVRVSPHNVTAWSNLAWARLKTGRRDRACDAAERSQRLRPPPPVASDLKAIIKIAKCDGRS